MSDSDILDCEDSEGSKSDNQSLGDSPDDPKLAHSDKSYNIYGGTNKFDKKEESSSLSSELTADPEKDYCIEPNNLYVDCRVYMP